MRVRVCQPRLPALRHLYALKKMAESRKWELPKMFSDKSYAVFKDIRLSTSTLSSPALQGGGFGPVSRTSYGVGYGIENYVRGAASDAVA